MKTTRSGKFIGAGLLSVYFAALFTARAADVDKVQLKNNQVIVWQGGAAAAATSDVALPFDILVKTNGAFTVKGGKERKLLEGETLGRDGMLLKPDGTIAPVMDHVSSNRGRIVVVKDGETREVAGSVQLGDGTTVGADGKIIPRAGSPRRVLDGELFQLGGGAIASRDTVTLQGGRVVVQKDGSTQTLEPARSITMNDGTKVLGDGTVIRFNGEQSKLAEGQILVIEGVAVRKP